MGNHFRTPGDESQSPAPNVFAPSDVSALDAQDQPSAAPDPFSYTTDDMPAAHVAPAAAPLHAASVAAPASAPAQSAPAANPLFSVPSPGEIPGTPSVPALNVPSPTDPTASSISEATFRTHGGDAGTSADADQARQVADLDAALANPDFTTVFAPVNQPSRKQQAREAGVEPVILMEHVTKIYPAQPNKPALDDVNLEIYPGEFVFLVGHSGSGKTTLLNTMLRNVKPTSGRILVAGQDLMRIKNRKIPFLRRQIGAVFQDYKLLPNRTAYENVAFALQCIGKPRGVIRAQVPEVLRLVGLADQMDSLPDQLSGGEQQRVSVARAMVNRPPLLICDEPTGNLDPAISLGIMKLLERINRTGTTVIVATHDREMVDSMHRRVIALEGGRVIRDQERGGYGNYDAF